MCLDAQDDDIERARVAEASDDLRMHFEIAVVRDNAQSVFGHGAKVRATGEERDVLAGAGEERADITSDGSGSGDQEAHGDQTPASALATAPRWILPVAVRGMALVT